MNNHSKPTSESSYQDCILLPSQSFSIRWQHIQDMAKNDKTHAERVFKAFIQLVESNHREHHSPKFYADKLNMTRSNLQKICQKVVELPPSYCVNACLMLEACALLKSSKTIKEITLVLGFESPKYFARYFRKHSGRSPDFYRKCLLDARDYRTVPKIS